MAGESSPFDARIADALCALAGDTRRPDDPPPVVWDRIAEAVDGAENEPEQPADPPAGLWDRIAAEVGLPDDGSEAGATPPDGGTPPSLTVLPTRPPRRRLPLLIAAAALVALGLGAALVLALQGEGDPATEQVAQATLSGSDLQPGSAGSGSAELVQRGDDWEVQIDAEGLPALDDGMYYEAWLLSAGGDEVQSLGTIDSTGTFQVPPGLAIDDYPLVDISIEPIDGDPGHSSESVLRGRLT